MGTCQSIHPTSRKSYRFQSSKSTKKDPLPVLLPADVDYVLKKLSDVEARMAAENQQDADSSWRYRILTQIQQTYLEILRIGEQPFNQHRNMQKDNLGARTDMLETLLREH